MPRYTFLWMESASPITTDIVLLGAGHAHVEVLRLFARRPSPGLRLTLVSPEPQTPYSGMLPGLLRGEYAFDAAHIDLAPLTVAARARLILAEATAINLDARTVEIAGRPDLPFDLLSINIGGEPARPACDGVPVKPISGFLDRLAALEASLPQGARIAIAGAGPAGTELAFALAHRFQGWFRLTLVCDTADPLPAAPPRARVFARNALLEAGVELVCGVQAAGISDGKLALSDGSFLAADDVLWTTGTVARSFLARSGLACDPSGCMAVDRGLRSTSHPFVFAAGDCASMAEAPRPKAGVWAVRAGGVLAGNLRRAAQGQTARRWHPQSQALVIIGLGNGRALAWRNGVAVTGDLVWRLKDRIDRRWIRTYSTLPAPASSPRAPGGTGSNVSEWTYADAATPLPAGTGIVQTVGRTCAAIDDPFLFGAIAAAHALSDLHAMGIRPWTALAVASLPHAPSPKWLADLAAMMRGVASVLEADHCALVAGHAAEAGQTALALTITGLAGPVRPIRASALRPGDMLIATKRLGTGLVLAGNRRGLAKARWLQAAFDQMRVTNRAAAGILRGHGSGVCATIGRVGLAGQVLAMLEASGVAARLRLDALPALPGALELAARGIESEQAAENLTALRRTSSVGNYARVVLLTDAQTSGGLVAAIDPARAQACIDALGAAGVVAAVIGWVEPFDGEGARIIIEAGGI